MRNRTLEHRNFYQIFLCCFNTFCNSSRNFTGFTKTVANNTVTITYNNDGSECECTTTLSNLSNTINSNQAVFKLGIVLYFNSIYHNRILKFKSSITGSICHLLNSTVIQVTIAVEHNSSNSSLKSLLCHHFTDLLSLF